MDKKTLKTLVVVELTHSQGEVKNFEALTPFDRDNFNHEIRHDVIEALGYKDYEIESLEVTTTIKDTKKEKEVVEAFVNVLDRIFHDNEDICNCEEDKEIEKEGKKDE